MPNFTHISPAPLPPASISRASTLVRALPRVVHLATMGASGSRCVLACVRWMRLFMLCLSVLARSLMVMSCEAHGVTFHACAKLIQCTDTDALCPNALQSLANALSCAGYTNRELTEGTNRKYRGGMRLAEDSAGISRTPSREPLESFSLESLWRVSGELLELLQSI